MPRKTTRRKPRAQRLNQVRGAGRGPEALLLARILSATGERSIIPWTVRNLRVAGAVSALRPHSPPALHSQPILPSLELGVELQWAVESLVTFAPQVLTGLRLQREISDHLIAGQGDQALAALDAMDEAIGLSLTSIATRLAVLQLHGGLEAQKDELARLRSSGVAQNVQFFAYWWSVRAEESSSWKNFARNFERRMAVWDISQELRTHIAFQVLRRLPPSGDEAKLISASHQGAAIDLYNAVLACAGTAIAEDRPTAGMFARSCSRLAEHIDDPRLRKLLKLHDPDAAALTLERAPTAWRDFGLGIEPEPAAPPAGIGDLFARALPCLEPDARGTLSQRIRHALTEIASAGGLEAGRAELAKLGAMFDHLPMGNWISEHCGPGHPFPAVDPTRARWLFCLTGEVEPESLAWLDPVRYTRLVAQTGSAAPLSWDWHRSLAGNLAPAMLAARLSPRASLELSAMLELSDAPASRLSTLADELDEHSGAPSELSLLCRLRGLERSAGVEAAIAFCVDRMLADASLAHWLPLAALARKIEDEEIPRSNIDVPVFLDFTARMHGAEFAPARTYAAEDFVLTVGATTPLGLAGTGKPEDANDRRRYFFGEVCVPATLRTSTLFTTQQELETDRIGLCLWLIDADPRQADRYEEEARELVRSRHIRQGLQALQGSKLALDIDNLRRWAERVVKEDYERYMDLLEQGIFTLDEAFHKSVYAALEAGSVAQKALEIPDNEAAALFARLCRTVLKEFALSPEHGLDAYLSLRIRHGTLSGHLRGPIEREHLITRKNSAGAYADNDYWIEHLAGELGFAELEWLDDALKAFSAGYDGLIAELTNEFIQIRSEDKPKGMISTIPSSTLITLMITDIAPGQSFDDFFVRSEEYFWTVVASSKEEIDRGIEAVTERMSTLFDRLDDAVRSVAPDGAGPLRDALIRAKGTALQGVASIAQWLSPPTTQGSLILTVEELVHVSLEVVKGFYPDFQPKVELDIAELPSFPGVLRLFSDIFFNIFENIVKYSGTPTDPVIKIAAWDGEDQIYFRVENSVAAIRPEDLARVERARAIIADGSFRHLVRGEGGTGLPKLAKVIGYGAGGGTLSFTLDEESKIFAVEFSLRKILVAELAGGQA